MTGHRARVFLVLTGWCFSSIGSTVHAQSDAEMALSEARMAYANEQFEQARDAAQKASETDAQNPDVFLLLGKAHYQLGELEQAMSAWRTVLELAPDHSYARRMLDALQAGRVEAETQIRVAARLIDDGLLPAARDDLRTLIGQPLSDAQRDRVFTLLAEIAIQSGDGQEALRLVTQLTARNPDTESTPPVRLLTARAQVVAGGESLRTGLSELTELANTENETREGKVARLELLRHRLSRQEDVVADVAAWIAENETLPESRRARMALSSSVNGFLSKSQSLPAPEADSELNQYDRAAFAAAGHALTAFVDPTGQVALIQTLIDHLEKRYVSHNAFAAARRGLTLIEDMQLPTVQQALRAGRRHVDESEASFQFTRLSRDLGEKIASPSDLQTWMTEHPGHPREEEALRTLVFALLSVTQSQAAPGADAELSESDLQAITAARRLTGVLSNREEASKLIQHLAQHFQNHYFNRGAQAAGIAGVTALLPLESPARRGALMQTLVAMHTTVALDDLKTAAAAGTIPHSSAELPESLDAASEMIAETCRIYPTALSWKANADLAIQVLDIAGGVAWPTRVTAPKAAHTWSIELALRAVKQKPDIESLTAARAVIDRIVEELSAVQQDTATGLATEQHGKLLSLLSEDHSLWPEVALRHVDLLTVDANRTFEANVRTGHDANNLALTETQKTLLALLSDVVQRQPSLAPTALQKLDVHLQKWSVARHDSVIESAYQALAANLPPATQRQTQLALAAMWFSQVLRDHGRIVNNGFQIERALDERAQRALKTCYELAADLGKDDPLRPRIALLRTQIVEHYLALDYEGVAAEAIRVKGEIASSALDEAAELELAALKRRSAERQLARQLQQYGGKDSLTLSPAFNEAIAALKTFITAHADSERVPQAADGILEIAALFEQHEAWLIAAGIYQDFEAFASQIDALKQVRPGESTYPENAALARAEAMHSRAARALAAWHAAQPQDSPPPTELSEEFQRAQAAWQKLIADYRQRPVAQTAIERCMSIAPEYAALNAWDAADSVYAALLSLQMPLRSPERLEFGRTICQLGKVLPDHARTVLDTLTIVRTDRGGKAIHAGQTLLAGITGVSSTLTELDSLRERVAGNRADTGSMTRLEGRAVPPVTTAADQPADKPEAAAEVSELADTAPKPDAASQSALPGSAGGGFGSGGAFANPFQQETDAQLMTAVRTQLDRQAAQIAMLRDDAIQFRSGSAEGAQQSEQQSASPSARAVSNGIVLSEAELERQQKVLDGVYEALQDIRQKFVETPTAAQARDEIFVIINHWRALAQWDRAARLATRLLADSPNEINLPSIRQDIARDWLAWASRPVRDQNLNREELLAEIARRFATARDELQAMIVAFPDEDTITHQAQWDIATSFLTQARVVAASSPTLARGQFVRAATELLRIADLYHDHPQIGSIPDMLWSISSELCARGYHEEAITVWNELQIHYPTHQLAEQSALQIARTWQQLGQPLRAAEAFLELNFTRGGNDSDLQNAIYEIAVGLKNEKRWIESLHVLQTFVDSFPRHAHAGQALTMIGEIHQANEVWADAIDAYRRVIDEFPQGDWTIEARWSIAECTINLSLWQEAAGAYAAFQSAYPEDSRIAEAARRVEILKTLDRYQKVIDEEGQRKAFDAQFQVAVIVRTELSNRIKAIIEYRKVAQNWPQSHLADDALFEVGEIYLELGETKLAREALLQSAERYPRSPLADDALLLVGTSYVSEADRLASVDRGKSLEIAKDIAQRQAYQVAQDNRKRQMERNSDQIAALRDQGKREEAATKEAYFAGQALQFDAANTLNVSNWAAQQEEVLSAAQLADRQDKINAALREAVKSFRRAASVVAADKADDALLQMAQIYDERLKDSEAAMATWEEIVRQYSGTPVAEDASWKMAQYYESQDEHQKAIDAYQAFFRNYRRSPRAGQAQAAIAENFEHLGEWVQAMDAYTNYVNNFPEGPLVKKAQEQINWIKTYRL